MSRRKESLPSVYTAQEVGASLNSSALLAMGTAGMKEISETRKKVLRNHTWQLSQILLKHGEEQALSKDELVAILAATALFVFVLDAKPGHVKQLSAFTAMARQMITDDEEGLHKWKTTEVGNKTLHVCSKCHAIVEGVPPDYGCGEINDK